IVLLVSSFFMFFFFFQAEDGIRDFHVTGVQTCALPIYCMLGFAAGMMLAASSFSLILPGLEAARGLLGSGTGAALTVTIGLGLRSEERRVGKGGRARGSPAP